MDKISILIIISAMLLPLNLFCTFWIFRELMNLSGVTFRETIKNIGGTLASIPTGRFHGSSRHRRRIIYNYLLEGSYEPERTKVLFKRYLYSTVPGLLSVLLSGYIAIFCRQNQKSIAVAGICVLFVVNAVLFLCKQIYRKNNPLDEKAVSVLEEKRNNYENKSVATKVRYIIVYTVMGAIFLSIYIFLNLSIAQIAQGKVHNGTAPGGNTTVKLDRNKVRSILKNQGFETDGIKTTYWDIKEELLSFVVAGEKDNTKFEFYEYGDSNTAESVYGEIRKDLSKKSSPGESSEHEKELKNGGDIITFEDGGIKTYLICEDGNIIYAYAPIGNSEIETLLCKLGCTVK